MPRVTSHKKNSGGRAGKAEYACCRCSDPIIAGDQFYAWSFRYGGTYRQHAKHGYPRQSQLTQARIGEVYAAIESVEDLIGGEGEWDYDDAAAGIEDAGSVAREIADEARSTADEYFGGGGPHAERADELEGIADELDDAAQQVRDLDGEQTEETDKGDEVSAILSNVSL